VVQKLAKNVLAEIERAVRDNPDALVALISPEGVFLYISPSVEQILGWPQEHALGHNIDEYYPPAEVSHIHLTIQDALLGDRSMETTRNTPLQKGGSRRMSGAMQKVTDEDNGNNYVISVARPKRRA
jgi:PAS domain S-box-containing protein